ncbi:MAG: bifunctional [glutamine synthetase] adenylyltransferase/[glutamine synthetase]-adenylyl-L-tyrosine phosphorylase [Magnetovibrio sp.]|nr:bifunctional [glutamine synthetase] adenylyltransferase/[glutamine synthetase]-adenylyl-L-tyrosine phosphorylase [Magnetovibrio sp.]
MPEFRFFDSISSLPDPHDSATAETGRAAWLSAAESTGEADAADVARAVLDDPTGGALIDGVFGNSPFLALSASQDPKFLGQLMISGPDEAASGILHEIAEKGKESLNDDAMMRVLRQAKRRIAMTIALADIAGHWDLARVTGALSETATAALDAAVAHLLSDGAAAFAGPDPADPSAGSGYIVLGMGKLGARELNYSSDIDLIVLYDEDRIETDTPDKLQNRMVRLTRGLVRLMDERTADGYVFRTDLRLRPDPGATPLALSVAGAETYYESLGQNWERAAMIKARAVAGDIAAGAAFLDALVPFVWRKSLDFAAIQDIHSIKRQINAHKGGTGIRAAGHNIKLGQGGIREIEFFAQTQQLIWGGREPGLRASVTVDALRDLAGFGLCDAATADDLIESYGFLRRVEHRLQMINDEQTQTLPEAEDDFRRLATFLGYASDAAFAEELIHHLGRTQDHYGQLFADAPGLGAEGRGNLVFTGADVDPDTLETLTGMGFGDAKLVDATVRGWHHGRHRAVRSTRAREILTELMPRLLAAVADTPDPDAAITRFDGFLAGLPAGVQLFSMIQANPQLLDLLAQIIGTAPRLARHLSGRPSVLDSVLTPDFFAPLPDAAALADELGALLRRCQYLEDVLNASRRWAHDRRFQVGVQQLQDLVAAEAASGALSHIAETALAGLYGPVEAEFAEVHGRLPGSAMAMLALGKLGSREMTASSDLDLVFIYHVADDAGASDGAKPLVPTQYFARLSQRLINALTALTPEGSLYEVDMRLRPSGNSGPIATSEDSFAAYHAEEAWTWEHMALTRARVVMSTDPDLTERIEGHIRAALTKPRDADTLLRDVAAMRARLAREKPADCLWSLKQIRGGTVDIEFIVQYLALEHAQRHPDLLAPSPAALLANLAERGLIEAGRARVLADALELWHGLQGMLSLTVEDEITAARVDEFSDALKSKLARIGGADGFAALETKVQGTAAAVYEIFQELIEAPAGALPAADDADSEAPAPPL